MEQEVAPIQALCAILMSIHKINIIFFLLPLYISCSTGSDKAKAIIAPDRMCDCFKLLDRQERGFYLKYLDGENTFYTGKCLLTRDNGNEITYKYLNGHILEIIERYPGGRLNEEIFYDTTGRITKRARYYTNGHISYIDFHGDHSYETFYENGRIQRKGMFGLRKNRALTRDKDFYNNTLYDSIWKVNGEFDSVYHYSEASITY